MDIPAAYSVLRAPGRELLGLFRWLPAKAPEELIKPGSSSSSEIRGEMRDGHKISPTIRTIP
jgi:hypothetical protein